MTHPQYGKVKTVQQISDSADKITTNSYSEGKLDWHRVEIQETIRAYTHNELVAPALELLGKMKNEKSPEVSLSIKQSKQGFTIVATHLVSKEKQ